MELSWFAELVKSQGVAIGGFLILLFIILNTFKKLINNNQEREDKLLNLLTNHIEENTKKLALISENLRKSSEEHEKMIELLVRIAERVKHG